MTGTRDLRNEGCIQASTPLEGEGIFGDAAIAMTATTSSVILCSSWKLSAGAPVGRRAEFAAGRLHALGKFVWVGKHRRTANAAVEGRAIRALLSALDQDAIKAAMAAYRAFEAPGSRYNSPDRSASRPFSERSFDKASSFETDNAGALDFGRVRANHFIDSRRISRLPAAPR